MIYKYVHSTLHSAASEPCAYTHVLQIAQEIISKGRELRDLFSAVEYYKATLNNKANGMSALIRVITDAY